MLKQRPSITSWYFDDYKLVILFIKKKKRKKITNNIIQILEEYWFVYGVFSEAQDLGLKVQSL